MKLFLTPTTLKEANAFVSEHHRHHRPVVGHKFSLAACLADKVVGVAIVGRPVSRMRDNGMTLEVTRLCTDGTRNACSFLYGAAARAAFALGYSRIGTYILASEPGKSLEAAGWRLIGQTKGGSWSRSSRPRIDKHPTIQKSLFEVNNPKAPLSTTRAATSPICSMHKIIVRGASGDNWNVERSFPWH